MMLAYTGMTLSIQVRDEAALAQATGRPDQGNQPGPGSAAAGGRGADPPQFRKKDGPQTQYVLEFPPGSVPDGPIAACLPNDRPGQGTTDPQRHVGRAREKALALVRGAAERRWSATGRVRASGRAASRRIRSMLAISDPRETMPVMIENLPQIVQALKAQMASAREEAPGPQFDLKIDPEKLPRADQLRPLLFPASTAADRRRPGDRHPPARGGPQRHLAVHQRGPGRAPAARRLSRRARRPAAPSAPTTSSRSCWRCTTIHSANNAFPDDITDKDGKPL